MKLVIDTNCLIQILPRRSRYHTVWQSFEAGDNIMCISNEIIEEYTEILQRLIDTEFVDCAIAAGAKYIVSNDRHYDILKKINYPKVDVIPLDEFIKTNHTKH